jgi:hypothetical protein
MPVTPAWAPHRPRWPHWIALGLIVFGVLQHTPSLRWGFLWDDLYHQLVLEDGLPGVRWTAWNLYDFDLRAQVGGALYDVGMPPWWIDADFYARFLRPVTSATLVLDHALYGAWAPGYHATNLAFFAALLALAWRFFLALGLSPRAALFALLLLALEDSWTLPAGWVANRNALLAALFCIATALCALHYAQRRARRWLLAAIACQILAFGAKESGLVAGPLAVLALWLGDADCAAQDWHAALFSLVRRPVVYLFAAVAGALLAVYVALGYGAHSLVYSAPWNAPTMALERIAATIPAAFFSLFVGLGTDLLNMRPELLRPMMIVGPVLIVLWAWIIVRTAGRSRLLAFAAAWLLLACLVEVGGELSDRLWVSAAVGSSIVSGIYLDALFRARPVLALRRVPAWLAAVTIVVAGVLLAPLVNLLRGEAIMHLGHDDATANLTAPVPGEPRPLDVIAFNARTSLQALGMFTMWRVANPGDEVRFFTLQYGRRPLRVLREDDRTLLVTSLSTPLASGRLERLFRTSAAPRPAGARWTTVGPTIEAVEIDGDGYRSIRVRLPEPLESRRYCWLAFQDGALRRVELPAIGAAFELAEVPEPLRGVP